MDDIQSPVLVVGAGQGLLVAELRSEDFQCDGVDFSCEMIGHAKSRRGLDLIQADASALPLGNAIYETIIYATGVVDFNGDEEAIQNILSEGRRVVRPGGRILVAFSLNFREDASDFSWCHFALRPQATRRTSRRPMADKFSAAARLERGNPADARDRSGDGNLSSVQKGTGAGRDCDDGKVRPLHEIRERYRQILELALDAPATSPERAEENQSWGNTRVIVPPPELGSIW